MTTPSEQGAATEPPPSPDHSVPLRLRLFAAAGIVLAAVYSLACLVYDAPDSPLKVRLASQATSLLEPYFEQNWQLFAPTPGTDNDHLYLEVELIPAGMTTAVVSQPVEIEDAVDKTPRGNRLLPTKLPGVLLAFNENADQYVNQSSAIEKLPKDQQPALRKALDNQFSVSFSEMQRFLSVRAESLYPNTRIVAVRATFKRQDIVPFSQRYEVPAPTEPEQPLLQTSWMPYIQGVAS